ncbi:hypothetical protein ACFS07_21105 [Undibacterium arcticum]
MRDAFADRCLHFGERTLADRLVFGDAPGDQGVRRNLDRFGITLVFLMASSENSALRNFSLLYGTVGATDGFGLRINPATVSIVSFSLSATGFRLSACS